MSKRSKYAPRVKEGVRLAHVAPYLYPHVGGVESHVEAIAACQAQRGHDVTVVTSRLPGTPVEERRSGYRILRIPQLANLFNTPVTPSLGQAIAPGAFDLVHTHSPPPLSVFFAARATRRHGIPHVLTYHCDLEIPLPGGGLLVELYRRTLGRYAVKSADAIVATTRTYASTSRALWSHSNVHVVPNPVDPARFHPGVDGTLPRERHALGERPIALFVGRLTGHKGIEEFIRAAPFTDDDLVHLVVGHGPHRARLERLARDLPGGSDKVVFAGRIEYADLPAYYAAASFGVLPSTSRLEAFGIAALEAMSTGRPVVVSRIPGVNEVISDGETGLAAEPLDARDLAEKMNRLTQDPELAATMGKRARERVLNLFSIDRVTDGLDTVYEAVLARA